MTTATHSLPLSAFEARPFAHHEPGSLLILPMWRKTPGPLCLALRIDGLMENGTRHPAAVILQGRPLGGDRDDVGEILTQGQLRDDLTLGWKSSPRVEVDRRVQADMTGERGLRDALGAVVLGEFGVRIVAGRRQQGHWGWGTAINPVTWHVDEGAARGNIAAVIDNWSLILPGFGGSDFWLTVSTV